MSAVFRSFLPIIRIQFLSKRFQRSVQKHPHIRWLLPDPATDLFRRQLKQDSQTDDLLVVFRELAIAARITWISSACMTLASVSSVAGKQSFLLVPGLGLRAIAVVIDNFVASNPVQVCAKRRTSLLIRSQRLECVQEHNPRQVFSIPFSANTAADIAEDLRHVTMVELPECFHLPGLSLGDEAIIGDGR